MILEKLPALFLFLCFGLIIYFLYRIVEPFIIVLLLTGVLATVTFPLYEWFLKKMKKPGLASLLTCLIVIFAIIIPLVLFIFVLVQQLVDLYHYVEEIVRVINVNDLISWKPGNWLYDFSGAYRETIASFVRSNLESFKSALAESARFISTFAASQSAKILASIGLLIFNFFLLFFALYFFYKDGRKIVAKVMSISPIPIKHEQEILRKFREISYVTLIGTFLTACVQGLIAWLGFSIAGVANSFFWGAAVAVASLIPVVGTTLVTIPIGLALLISGNVGWGLFVLVWAIGVVATVDNLVRIIFIGSTVNLNPLLAFLAVFGGITAFGLPGVVIGPMILVLFLTFLHIYEEEYQELLLDPQVAEKVIDKVAKEDIKQDKE